MHTKTLAWIHRIFEGYLYRKDTSIGVDEAMGKLKRLAVEQ